MTGGIFLFILHIYHMNEYAPIVVQDANTNEVIMVWLWNDETQAISQKTWNVTFWASNRNMSFTKWQLSGNVLQIVTTQFIENILSDGVLWKNSVVYKVNQILKSPKPMSNVSFTEQEFPNIFSEESLIADCQNFLAWGISREAFEVLANKRVEELRAEDQKSDELYRSWGMWRPWIMDGAVQWAPNIRAEVNRLLSLAYIQE